MCSVREDATGHNAVLGEEFVKQLDYALVRTYYWVQKKLKTYRARV
jgi:hypothetical protein